MNWEDIICPIFMEVQQLCTSKVFNRMDVILSYVTHLNLNCFERFK